DYMIPASFVELEKLPLTPNGKVDKKALPEPSGRMQTGAEYVAPTNPTEEMLVRVWQEVLGIEQVGIHDNFFRLGGDSIKAIQIASRLNQHNCKFKIQDLFQHPTVSELASYVQSADLSVEQGIIEGEVMLAPIQKWAFQLSTNIYHWNMGLMLYRPEGWEVKALEQAFGKIVEHHDALRMVYSTDGGTVVQRNRGMEGELLAIEVFDLTGEADVRERILLEANRLHRKMNLRQGPLVQLGVFQTLEGDHLLIAIHHLVVDAISLRILMEDFTTAYQQALEHKEIVLPPKTDSFRTWSRKLHEYANSDKLLQEIPYWKEIEETPIPALPKDKEGPDTCFIKDSEMVVTTLNEEETNLLLTDVHQAYQTEINDLLLTSLALTVREWTQAEKIAVTLEGHGREEIIEGVDITRTVGWFTAMYPVIFNLKTNDLSQAIQVIKENLRLIPNRGIGHSILKHLTTEENKKSVTFGLTPEITFNYLGQVDSYSMNSMPVGEAVSPETKLWQKLDVNGAVTGEGILVISFRYNAYVYRRETIESLVKRYKHYLREIISHCRRQESTVLQVINRT
ncbi:condensation domain-containing protein, partial [Paenactinomyces guangxiensis]